ncbi:MAG: ribonuclease Y [Desulfohalobiaceae bacterium]|nr:ribonuclease Y [Desulfohalobiaceae bacterium]MCF8106851.1 ribonuclease Y [Desulfohalobiaceae bacterium]
MEMLLVALSGVLVGLVAGYVLLQFLTGRKMAEANSQARKIIENAEKEARAEKKELLLQGQEELQKQKRGMEQEIRSRENIVKKQEDRLQQKEERLEEKQERAAKKDSDLVDWEKRLAKSERELEKKEKQCQHILAEQEQKLQEISGLTAEEAKKSLFADIESKTRHEAARMIRQIEMEAKESADRKSREVLATAIQRYAGDHVSEYSVSAVELPSEDMKGRIIGREGRNIRSLEAATGVDFIVDDTPETVVISAHSPLRREKAKQVLERLIGDGRIHPARIEDVVKKVDKEMEVKLREKGEQATFDVGVHGIHPELVRLLGQLYYRTSFSQNVLHHSLEVSSLCGIMAAELKMDEKKAKRAGLLHDIGKAVDHEVEGPHAVIGADLAKKYNESKEIIHAIAAHHEDVQPASVLAVLVQAADSLSGARPGARKELLENYVKRLEDLENVAVNFKGVGKVFAIQAGRELRVMVDCNKVSEDETYTISRDIAKAVEEKLTYPGQIKVTCIREKRAVHYAK